MKVMSDCHISMSKGLLCVCLPVCEREQVSVVMECVCVCVHVSEA